MTVDPELSGSVVRSIIQKKLETVGVNVDILPERFEYRVRELCVKIMYGDKMQWYGDLNGWGNAFQAADPQNVFVLEAESNHYQRCFIATGVARRLAG